MSQDLVKQFAIPENTLESIKEQRRGKPTTTISIKEASNADAILEEIMAGQKPAIKTEATASV